MMRTLKQLGILATITGIAVTAAVLLTKRDLPAASSTPPANSQVLFPGLFDQLPQVSRLVITQSGERFAVEKQGDHWILPDHHGYPASFDKIKRFLWAMADLEIVARKTHNPDLYAQLEVEDAEHPEAHSTQVTLDNNTGHTLASLVVGKIQGSRHLRTEMETFYARIPQQAQVYLVAGNLPLEKTSLDWADRQLFHWQVERLARMEIQYPHTPTRNPLVIVRGQPNDPHYQVADLQPHEAIRSQFVINNMANTFSRLRFAQIRPIQQPFPAGFPPKPTAIILAQTFDGLLIRASVFRWSPPADRESPEHEPQYWVQIHVSAAPQQKTDTAVAFPLKPPEAVDKEIQMAQTRHQGWWYQIPAYQIEDVQKTRRDLVGPPAASAASTSALNTGDNR